MPKLETVDLSHFAAAAYGPICDTLCRAGTLNCLNVSNIGETTGVSERLTEQYPMCIEKMYISNFRDGPENLRRLVSWPKKIKRLELESEFQRVVSGTPWGLQELMPAIVCQKDNLYTLAIGKVPKDDTGLSGFSVTDFPNLEELNLSYWSTGTRVAEQAKLIAPRLRKLTWCFNTSGEIEGMGCDLNQFGELEENWLRSLMKTAIELKACLSHVHVDFYPDHEVLSQLNLNHIVFP